MKYYSPRTSTPIGSIRHALAAIAGDFEASNCSELNFMGPMSNSAPQDCNQSAQLALNEFVDMVVPDTLIKLLRKECEHHQLSANL